MSCLYACTSIMHHTFINWKRPEIIKTHAHDGYIKDDTLISSNSLDKCHIKDIYGHNNKLALRKTNYMTSLYYTKLIIHDIVILLSKTERQLLWNNFPVSPVKFIHTNITMELARLMSFFIRQKLRPCIWPRTTMHVMQWCCINSQLAIIIMPFNWHTDTLTSWPRYIALFQQFSPDRYLNAIWYLYHMYNIIDRYYYRTPIKYPTVIIRFSRIPFTPVISICD